MAKTERTSPSIASKAAKTLQDPNASKVAKTLAASVLAQSGTDKVTSARVAGIASDALQDGRTGSLTKSFAGSGLTQRPAKP